MLKSITVIIILLSFTFSWAGAKNEIELTIKIDPSVLKKMPKDEKFVQHRNKRDRVVKIKFGTLRGKRIHYSYSKTHRSSFAWDTSSNSYKPIVYKARVPKKLADLASVNLLIQAQTDFGNHVWQEFKINPKVQTHSVQLKQYSYKPKKILFGDNKPLKKRLRNFPFFIEIPASVSAKQISGDKIKSGFGVNNLNVYLRQNRNLTTHSKIYKVVWDEKTKTYDFSKFTPSLSESKRFDFDKPVELEFMMKTEKNYKYWAKVSVTADSLKKNNKFSLNQYIPVSPPKKPMVRKSSPPAKKTVTTPVQKPVAQKPSPTPAKKTPEKNVAPTKAAVAPKKAPPKKVAKAPSKAKKKKEARKDLEEKLKAKAKAMKIKF